MRSTHHRTSSKLLDDSSLKRQIEAEYEAIEAGVNYYRSMVEKSKNRGDFAKLKPVERLITHWYLPLRAAITQEKIAITKGQPGKGRRIYAPLFDYVPTDKMAYIALNTMLTMCTRMEKDRKQQVRNGIEVSRLSYAIGNSVIAEAYLKMMKPLKVDVRLPNGYDYSGNALSMLNRLYQHGYNEKLVVYWGKKVVGDELWSHKVAMSIGAKLIWMVIGSASLGAYHEDAAFELAFHHKRISDGRKSPAFIILDDKALKIIEEGHQHRQFLRPRYKPMVCKPYLWTHERTGGYIKLENKLITKPTIEQLEALRTAKMTRVYDALNAINRVGWRINPAMLKIVEKLWEEGGNVSRIPRRERIPMPVDPAGFDDEEIEKKHKREKQRIYDENRRNESMRIHFMHTLNVAREFKDEPVFYFPHIFDFRGRCYVKPLYLNHQGDDLQRSLLILSNPVELGVNGMRWLMIHAANLYGIKQCTFDEQVEWAEDNIEQIKSCARDPYADHNFDFWTKADRPFQFLATAMGITDPKGIGKYIPVQIDGTCNGLQHYAALGKNVSDAEVVNLMPNDSPSDIYQIVADEVKAQVERDVEKDVKEAVILIDEINRSMVKQPVMTTVYGVTKIGARKQIESRLQHITQDWSELHKLSEYLRKKTWKALEKYCNSATQIMEWLRQCAKISVDANMPVKWHTPIGFPVIQSYRVNGGGIAKIKTVLGKISIQRHDVLSDVAKGKQIQAFPPNYIHSIDSTHMLMTATACSNRGIEFAAIHDAFISHAGSIDQLRRSIRDSFVELHSQPLLDDLHHQLSEASPHLTYPEPPSQGRYNIRDIYLADYAFS